jgi:hypothetical protein
VNFEKKGTQIEEKGLGVLLGLSLREELEGGESSDSKAASKLLVSVCVDLGDDNALFALKGSSELLVLLQTQNGQFLSFNLTTQQQERLLWVISTFLITYRSEILAVSAPGGQNPGQ